MKQIKTLATSMIALTMMFFIFSCNSGGDKKANEATADSTAKMAPEPAKPFDLLIVQHKVADYAKWKSVYESSDSMDQSYGLKKFILGRGTDDSNMVIIIEKMSDTGKAKQFGGSPELKKAMDKAGVVGKPTATFLKDVMIDTTQISQTARVMVSHKVKDWDAWKKEFDEHKSARVAAGLIDRGLGYSYDDNHMVSIVFAITDMQKANAFFHSDDLKAAMAKGGVEGEPTVFFYNIAKKY